ncbi:MAG: Hsp33 family molecular chaperone HslO [Lachnospiraceae bacterium]|nr:Hsp33 family molecular chaperone HslO [Lachnospiraceae bacterium]MDY3222185.1 Hsp33 family molecular chaperone HslO [Lachnospiraceae bacterium]
MADYFVRATAGEAQIRAFAVKTRDTVEEARKAHNTSPVVTAALGRLLTAGAMMGMMLKGEKDMLTLQIAGDGPIGGITVTADALGHVKGYAKNPQVMIGANEKGKLDVAKAVGKGILRVIKDMGLKEPYVGQTVLESGEIAEDLTYYFANSEQVPSSVGLGVLMDRETNTVKQAGGFIIQLMPFADEETISRLESNLGKVDSVTKLFEEGKTPQQLLELLLEGLTPEILEEGPVEFFCNCDKERVEKALISLGKQELEELIAEGKEIELNCHFCGSSYVFSVEELKTMLKRARG